MSNKFHLWKLALPPLMRPSPPQLVIPIDNVTALEKRMTAYVIPNAIQVSTGSAKYTFASLLSQDMTYDGDDQHLAFRAASRDLSFRQPVRVARRSGVDDERREHRGGEHDDSSSPAGAGGGRQREAHGDAVQVWEGGYTLSAGRDGDGYARRPGEDI